MFGHLLIGAGSQHKAKRQCQEPQDTSLVNDFLLLRPWHAWLSNWMNAGLGQLFCYGILSRFHFGPLGNWNGFTVGSGLGLVRTVTHLAPNVVRLDRTGPFPGKALLLVA